MAYSRPLKTGTALKQTPCDQPGILQSVIEAEISTVSSLGVVQVGSGLSITPTGILSCTSGSGMMDVKLTAVNYTPSATDCFIGCTKSITVTLPLGVTGKVYIVKNQKGDDNGSVKVKCSGGQFIDTSPMVTLGEEDCITVVFDGIRWNLI